LQLANLLLVLLDLPVETQFLLLKHSFISVKLVTLALNLAQRLLLFDQLNLILDPLLLHLYGVVCALHNLLLEPLLLVLKRSVVFIAISILVQVRILSVEAVNTVLLLRDLDMAALDLNLFLSDVALFLLEFGDELVELFLKKFVLTLCVQIIDLDSGDFVSNIFNLDFFLGNLFVDILCLLNQVG